MKSSRLDLEIVKKYAKKRELLRQKLCLISQQPLLDPVYYEGQDGSQLVFSRARIVGWIQKYGTCPVSGMAIKVDVLRVYHTISSLENHFTECKLLSAEGELLSDALLQEKVSEMKQFVRRRFITELKLGDLPALQEIFADEIGKFVDIVTDGCSTLDIAIFTGKVKIVETLMRHGADLTFTSCGHVSPLDRAISRNEYLIVQLLLDAHATITMQDILSAAGIEGSNKVLDLILDNVASIKPDNKYSKLDILNMLLQKVARKFGSSLTIYRLVSMGADPNNKDSNGDTPLHSAVKVKNNEDNVLALLVSGAKADIQNNADLTPEQTISRTHYYSSAFLLSLARLKFASVSEDMQCSVTFLNNIKELPQSGHQTNEGREIYIHFSQGRGYLFTHFSKGKSITGFIPATLASLVRGFEIKLQALAKQCGDNNRELTELDKSIAHLKRMLIHDVELVIMNLCNETITQAQAQNDFCTANLKELLQSEGNVIVHMRDKHGQTPLIAAAMAHNPSVCRLLLDANADPLMVDNNGHNALFYALSRHENDEKRSVIPMLINSMIKQLALALDKDFIIKEVGSKDNFSGQIKAYELTHQANVMPTLIISLFEHKVPCKYIIALLLPPKFDDEFYDAIYDHIERRENPRECIKLCEAALYDNTHPFNYILTRQKKKFFRGDGGDALKKVLFLMEKTLSAHSQLFEQLNVDTIAFYSRNLSDAARNNDTTTLRNLIKLGIKVDFCDTARNNCTPLMDAVMKGHIGCVQQLVLQGASPALPLRGTKVQLLEIVKKALSGFRITDQLCAYLDAQAGEIVEISPQTYCAIIGSDRLLRCLNPVVLPVLDEPQETGVRRFGLYMDASQYNSRRNNDHILYDEFTTCDL